MHLKRIAMPKSWPIQRKERKYIISTRGPHAKKNALPLLVVLRDMLGLVKNSREAKKVLQEGSVLVDNRVVKDLKFSIGLFDRIYIKKEEKSFSVYLTKKGKLVVREIAKERLDRKPAKIISKKSLKGKRLQINLIDGKNCIISDEKSLKELRIDDSVVINLKEGKVVDHLALREGAYALIIGGRHKGSRGKIAKFSGEINEAEIQVEKEIVKVSKENIFVIEENELGKQEGK